MKKSKFTEEQIAFALKQAESGTRIEEVCRKMGMPASDNVGRFQFTGQAWLPEAGLYYFKARFYSASLGRFLQTDPIGYGGGMNLYAYVKGDPVNFTDPMGLDRNKPFEDIGGESIAHVVSQAKRIYEDLVGPLIFSPGSGNAALFELPTLEAVEPQSQQFPCKPGVQCRLPSEFGKCYGPPAAPGAGKSRADLMSMVRANGTLAAGQPLSLAGMLWFRSQVRNGGPRDYKQINSGCQNFGNYNYGYAGTAMGIGSGVLLRQAGRAQVAAGTSQSDWGNPGILGVFGGEAPFGDDPLDQMYISHGISDRSDGC